MACGAQANTASSCTAACAVQLLAVQRGQLAAVWLSMQRARQLPTHHHQRNLKAGITGTKGVMCFKTFQNQGVHNGNGARDYIVTNSTSLQGLSGTVCNCSVFLSQYPKNALIPHVGGKPSVISGRATTAACIEAAPVRRRPAVRT